MQLGSNQTMKEKKPRQLASAPATYMSNTIKADLNDRVDEGMGTQRGSKKKKKKKKLWTVRESARKRAMEDEAS